DRLSDKAAGGIDYDLSSFVRLDPSQPRAVLPLGEPFQATSIGFVGALKGDPLPEGSALATLTLEGAGGTSQTVAIKEGQLQPFGILPNADKLATRWGTAPLQAPIAVQSVTATLNALGEEFYLNGLALIDDRTGRSISPLVAAGGGFKRVYEGDVKIYRNEHALPPAFLVHDARLAESGAEALSSISVPSFDPAASAVVEANAAPPPSRTLSGRAISKLVRTVLPRPQFSPPKQWFQPREQEAGSTDDSVEPLSSSPEHAIFRTSSPRDGFLIRTQSYFPGWEAAIDGKPAELLAGDYLFQAVHVPAGEHQVEFTYRPASFIIGAGISGLGLLVWVAGLALSGVLWRTARN
ncbi:MAG: YfhO family protein, partial [Chloroflexota bacterium]|nr:YfhO family protein [Chloroflexota bacterium]